VIIQPALNTKFWTVAFWSVTHYALNDRARFDEQSFAFSLSTPPTGIVPPIPMGCLIASLQQRLQEKANNETLFSVRWQVL